MISLKKTILNLYPLTKLVVFIMLTILSICMYKWYYTVWVLLLIFGVSFLCGNLKELFFTVTKTFGILVLIIFILQSLFYYKGSRIISFLNINLKIEGIIYALNISILILLFGTGFLLLSKIISLKDMVNALENKGLNRKVTYVLMATFLMIPEMKKKSKVIMEAQQCRGIEMQGNLMVRIKSFIPIIGTLILSSISNTEERALALDARGFSATNKKTNLYIISDTNFDKYIRKLSYILIILTIVGRMILWLI